MNKLRKVIEENKEKLTTQQWIQILNSLAIELTYKIVGPPNGNVIFTMNNIKK